MQICAMLDVLIQTLFLYRCTTEVPNSTAQHCATVHHLSKISSIIMLNQCVISWSCSILGLMFHDTRYEQTSRILDAIKFYSLI